jgi:hypothetical protein
VINDNKHGHPFLQPDKYFWVFAGNLKKFRPRLQLYSSIFLFHFHSSIQVPPDGGFLIYVKTISPAPAPLWRPPFL